MEKRKPPPRADAPMADKPAPEANVAGGVGLVLLACGQFVYSALALVSGVAVAGLEVIWLLIQGISAMGPHGKNPGVTPSESGAAFMDVATPIATLGAALAGFSLFAGVLLLRGRRPNISMGCVVALAVVLGLTHLKARWYPPAAFYALVAACAAYFIVMSWKRAALLRGSK